MKLSTINGRCRHLKPQVPASSGPRQRGASRLRVILLVGHPCSLGWAYRGLDRVQLRCARPVIVFSFIVVVQIAHQGFQDMLFGTRHPREQWLRCHPPLLARPPTRGLGCTWFFAGSGNLCIEGSGRPPRRQKPFQTSFGFAQDAGYLKAVWQLFCALQTGLRLGLRG